MSKKHNSHKNQKQQKNKKKKKKKFPAQSGFCRELGLKGGVFITRG